MPRSGCQLLGVVLQDAVGGEHHIEAAEVREQGRPGVRRASVGPRHQGRREAARFRQPVGQHRGRRHHQCGAVLGPKQQQGERLDGLAEAHVVRQAGADAAGRLSRQPPEALRLVRAQVRLQGGWHLRFESGPGAHPLAHGGPVVVGLQLCAFDQIFYSQGGEGVQSHGVPCASASQRGEVVQAAAEGLRQGQELAIAERQEAGLGVVLEQCEQAFEVQHPFVVHAQFAARLQPTGGGPDGKAQRVGLPSGHYPHRLPVGPLAAGADAVEALEEFQAVVGLRQQQRPIGRRLYGQRRAVRGKPSHGGTLGVEVPLRLHALAGAAGEHDDAASAGRKAGAGAGNRLYLQCHGQTSV